MRISNNPEDWAKSRYCRVISGQEWRLPEIKEAMACRREAIVGTRYQIRKDKVYLKQIDQAIAEMKERKEWHIKLYRELKRRSETTSEGTGMLRAQLYEEKYDFWKLREELKGELEMLDEFLKDNPEMRDHQTMLYFRNMASIH